jgi:hypothetical protein
MRKSLLIFILLCPISIDAFALKERVLPAWATVIDGTSDHHVVRTASNHYGLLDSKFKIAIDTTWDKYGGTELFEFGRQSVFYFKKHEHTIYNDSCHGGWLLLNAKGKAVINYKLRLPFDLAGVRWYYMHQLGVFQTENGKWGLCNSAFKVVQPPAYDGVWPMVPDTHHLYGDCSFLVKFNNKYGIVDTSGKLLVDTIYTTAYRPYSAFVVLANANDTLSFDQGEIDRSNKHFALYYQNTPLLTGRLITNIRLQYFMKYCAYDYYGTYYHLKNLPGEANEFFGNCVEEYFYYPRFQYHVFVEEADYLSFTYGFIFENLHKQKVNKWYESRLDTSLIVSNDSLLCMNYSIRNGKPYRITLDSLFSNKDGLAQLVRQNIIKANNDVVFASPDALQLSDKFMILPQGVELIFSMKNGEKTSFYSQVMPWKSLENFIDPRGPLRNKLALKKQ